MTKTLTASVAAAAATIFTLFSTPALAEDKSLAEIAARFGAMPAASNMRISPDGTHISFIDHTVADGVLYVADIETGDAKPVLQGRTDMEVQSCRWLNSERLGCYVGGEVHFMDDALIGYSRLIAVNKDGTNTLELGQRNSRRQAGLNQNSGQVIDVLPGDPDHVLLEVPQFAEFGARGAKIQEDGLSVQKVNIYDNSMSLVMRPLDRAADYYTDGRGTVRVYSFLPGTGRVRPGDKGVFRVKNGDGKWIDLFALEVGGDLGRRTAEYHGFDADGTHIYVSMPKDGRQAMYKLPADGGELELVWSHDRVDVGGIRRVGVNNRPIGLVWYDEYNHTEYFDPQFKTLATAFEAALDGLDIDILDETSDGNRVLLRASSERDPGTYYVFDRRSAELIEIMKQRPLVSPEMTAEVAAITYPASDGTEIPAYLFLPHGASKKSKGLPFVVMPHGGPESRDYWGYDWLAQSVAAMGYAVIQPQYRGSTGYGLDWLGENALKQWNVALSDVNDAAKWAIGTGLADPDKTVIFGWSYGGYAALQGAIVDPDLYKAVVAVAPVTDLRKLISDNFVDFGDAEFTKARVGWGGHLKEGSPRQRADEMKAPVLMFQGDEDLNVDVTHPRLMNDALKSARKDVTYYEYPELDHQLSSSRVRVEMLQKTGEFLNRHTGGPHIAAYR